MVAPIIFLSFVTLYLGFGAENIQTLSNRIAFELMDNHGIYKRSAKKIRRR